jgi:hydroxymethylglutaryl-CoA synthase
MNTFFIRYNIDPMMVGRLEVGTETIVDKSKSTKTILMDLFQNNTDIEGATIINACYGGTSALLNAFTWCNCTSWDGRYAIVVAGDIAAYARGPARPTCGIGAVAILIGANAPLLFNYHLKTTHASNVYDFYKPDHTVEYPTVDGVLSQICYYRALEDVYNRFVTKSTSSTQIQFDAEFGADYFVFHAPYNKLVQKSYARLYLCDARRRHEQKKILLQNNGNGQYSTDSEYNNKMKRWEEIDTALFEWLDKPIEETYDDKKLEGVLKKLSNVSYQSKLVDANRASQLVGNTYTASVFLGLASLIDRCGRTSTSSATKKLLQPNSKIIVFSYGSGAIATMYQLTVRDTTINSNSNNNNNNNTNFTISRIADTMKLTERLMNRKKLLPIELDYSLETRALMHNSTVPYQPIYPTTNEWLLPGTYYLNNIDSKFRRTYSRVPPTEQQDTTITLLSPTQSQSTTMLAPESAIAKIKEYEIKEKNNKSVTNTKEKVVEEETIKKPIACVITGTAAALPCGTNPFAKDNMDRLIEGHQFIVPISNETKKAMLGMNVVQVIKSKIDGKAERVYVNTDDDVIQLAAQLGSWDLTKHYGVVKGLAQTMDTAAQIAVAAGMEALKNAGLVSGTSNDPNEWMLPEQFRDTTGVVYASSFPALDAAVGEVMRFLRSKTVHATTTEQLVETIRTRLLRAGDLSNADEDALRQLINRSKDAVESDSEASTSNTDDDPITLSRYEFDRKFLFKLLVLGNSQLAQLTGCRGPNTQTNAACAGTTQAIAMAQDMLLSGRAQRVIVIAGDNASSETLLPWLGSGFRALGAACTKKIVEDAAVPFDSRRSGMLLGAGGIGMVIETEHSCTIRLQTKTTLSHPFEIKARLVATQYSNSAYHGASLDRKHIGKELQRFLNDVERIHGITKNDIATNGVYFSHETSTHATPDSSCSANEIAALRYAFDNNDELISKLLILNTKGATGHPMGVSFEDVTAVEVLMRQTVPPVANYKIPDPNLGTLNISTGGKYKCQYALRFAAGFGSQVAFALYAKAN